MCLLVAGKSHPATSLDSQLVQTTRTLVGFASVSGIARKCQPPSFVPTPSPIPVVAPPSQVAQRQPVASHPKAKHLDFVVIGHAVARAADLTHLP